MNKEVHSSLDYCQDIALSNGHKAHIRPIVKEDKDAMLKFFNRMSAETRFMRFHYTKEKIADRELEEYCNVDYNDNFAFVAEIYRIESADIVGVGRYFRLPCYDTAEVAFVVEDKEQRKGICTHLLNMLAVVARERGISIFVAELLNENVVIEGAHWAIKKGFGLSEDLAVTEETGCLKGANPDKVSAKARLRGTPQLGTLGAGNHFLEVQVVREIYDKDAAKAMGIDEAGQVLFLIHTGSRGFGHQVCGDYLKKMEEAVRKYDISLPDRQLACAPVESDVELDHMLVDACAMRFIQNPSYFDVIVTENTFGDIITDEASMLAGSMGMLPSASLAGIPRGSAANAFGLYEPIHGSAPRRAGQNIANPIATILSVAMMLQYSLGLVYEAETVEKAVNSALEAGYRTYDIMDQGMKKVGTSEMGSVIVDIILNS